MTRRLAQDDHLADLRDFESNGNTHYLIALITIIVVVVVFAMRAV